MSAPNTDIEKQEKRHAGPLIGMAGGVILALIFLGAMMFFLISDGESPRDDAATVQPGINTPVVPAD
ncbi:hypothetical protein JQC91_09615 [Jannaschia sp. Os4]|uniref:hypothetical protein n=1 Tax=Jannaschia sp. Os4 TaxID=2807617 RepID=UPI00193A5A58|nr:hypothetical protein [Jannaschia sp. Os4]MBM2576562.1 hypothetical protein [Jannaschia sp. Os4]